MCSAFFEGDRTFLSVVDAGREFGYSSDYVARLCRTKKVAGRMIGRSWFVDRDALVEYIERSSEEKRGRAEQLAQERKRAYATRSLESPRVASIPETALASQPDTPADTPADAMSAESDFSPKPHPSPADAYSNTFGDQKLTLRAVLLSVLLVSSMFLYVATPRTQEATAQLANSAAGKFLALVSDSKTNDSQNVLSLTAQTVRITEKNNEQLADDTAHADVVSEGGMVVVPSSGNTNADEALLSDLAESFSDEVEILPDEGGTTGVIKPVFKEGGDDAYLYLLVPIEEASSTEISRAQDDTPEQPPSP